jgi:2-keto-3-deoxy-L-rhamnonate aldolase RhmA
MTGSGPSGLRARLKAREPLLGTFTLFPCADVAELAGRAGFDLVVVDLEHAGKDWHTVQHMIRAVNVSGACVLVRVGGRDDAEILRVLEAGADGIVIPFVESADDARRIRDLVRYSPVGSRGTCTMTRAAQFGLRRAEFGAVTREANDSVITLALIESRAGVENIDAILAVEDGFDGFLIGRADLAADLGHPGEIDHPGVTTAIDRLTSAVLGGSGAALSVVTYTPDEAPLWRARGMSLVFYSADTAVLAQAWSSAVDAARAAPAHDRRETSA